MYIVMYKGTKEVKFHFFVFPFSDGFYSSDKTVNWFINRKIRVKINFDFTARTSVKFSLGKIFFLWWTSKNFCLISISNFFFWFVYNIYNLVYQNNRQFISIFKMSNFSTLMMMMIMYRVHIRPHFY